MNRRQFLKAAVYTVAAVVLPFKVAANVIPKAKPAPVTGGLTVEKLRRAKAILDANEVPQGELVAYVSESQYQQMCQTLEDKVPGWVRRWAS